MDNAIKGEMSDSRNVAVDIIAGSDILQSSGAYEEYINKKRTAEDSTYHALKCFNNFNQKSIIEQNLNFCANERNFISDQCKNNLGMVGTNETNIKNLSDTNTSVLETEVLNTQPEQQNHRKTDNNFEATDDESMAVEALRQLGGIYDDNIVAATQVFPILHCENKMQSSTDMCSPNSTCKNNQLLEVHVCPLCRKNFDSEQNFQHHNCTAVREKHICNFCNSSFFTKNDLQKHISFNHPGTHRCSICNVNFHRPSSLTNHMKIHNYQPGRAIATSLNPKQPERIVDSSLDNVWCVEQALISEVTDNTVTSDTLSSWNFNYNTVSQIIQNEVNQDVSSLEQEISNNFAQDSTNNTLDDVTKSLDECPNDYETPVKVEILPYVSEKSMDESFPILSLPQMEVIIRNDEVRPYTCTHCGLTFSRSKALISHKKLHTFNWRGTYECSICGEVFPSEELKDQHSKNCLGNEQLLETHMEQVNDSQEQGDSKNLSNGTSVTNKKPQVKVGKHACPDCDKRFATKQKMYRHMWIHRKKIFTCELCAMTFKLQTDLDKHRLSQHPADSPYVCQECGKSFASRQGLWEHGRVHGGGPAGLFRCTECGKTFTSRQGFLIHNRTHTGERPYGCRFCLKAFRDGGTLRKHERIHTGERPHVCPICLHDFNQKVVLREHVRWVHAANKIGNDDGMFVCQLCNVAVADREELCAHIVKHSDRMAAEAKDSNSNALPRGKTVKKARHITASTEPSNILPVATDKITNKQVSDAVLIDSDFDINTFDFSPDVSCIECDMCGNKFTSQKELMTHVQIHI